MAPTNSHSTRRGGTGSGRPYRNANANAGVNRDRSTTRRDATRARDLHLRSDRVERAQPPTNAPIGSSLASRMTFGDSRGRGRDSIARDSIARGSTTRPGPQNGRRLQDRITRADVDIVGGAAGAIGDGERATRDLQVNHRVREQDTRVAPQPAPAAVPTTIDSDVDIDIDIGIDNITFDNSEFNTNGDFSQASAIFYDAQPTQLADAPVPLSPPTSPVHLSLPPGPMHLFPPTRPRRTAVATQPIRMVNHPIHPNINDKAEHPVDNYRGKDPIKQRVTNKKLRAVLAGKKVPGERKKHRDERMELRVGTKGVLK